MPLMWSTLKLMEGSRHHLLLQAIRVFPHVERIAIFTTYIMMLFLEHSMNVIMSQPPRSSVELISERSVR